MRLRFGCGYFFNLLKFITVLTFLFGLVLDVKGHETGSEACVWVENAPHFFLLVETGCMYTVLLIVFVCPYYVALSLIDSKHYNLYKHDFSLEK